MSGSGSNVEVRITGSVDSSLAQSTARAQASIDELAASAQAWGTKLQASAAGTSAATAAIQELAPAASEAGDATEGLAGKIPTATREFRALFDELSSGRTRMVPGTIAILAQRVFDLGPASLVAGGALLAVGGALAYMVYQSVEAQKEIDNLAEGFALTGRGAQTSADAVGYELDFLKQIPGVTSAAAQGFMSLVARNASWSESLANQVGQLMPAFIDLYGKEAPQAAGKLMESLSDLTETGFEKLDRELLNLSPQQYQTVQNLIKTGDTAKATSLILQQLSANSGIYIKSLGDQVYDIEQKMEQAKRAFAETKEWAQPGTAAYDQQLQNLQQLAVQLQHVRDLESNQGQQQDNNQYKQQLDDAEQINSKLNERGTILQKIAQLQRDEAEAQQKGDTAGQATFNAALQAEQTKLQDFDKKTTEESYRTFEDSEQAKAEAFKSGSAQRITIAQEEVDKASALFGKESTEYEQALGRLNSERRAAADQAAEEAKRSEEKRVQAAKRADDEIADYDRQTTEELNAIARSHADTSIQIARMDLDAKKDVLQQEVDAGEITKDQMLAQLRDLVTQEDGLDIQALGDQKRNADLSLAQEKELDDKILVAKEKLKLDLASINTQIANNDRQTAQQSLKAWEDANRELISSEKQLVGEIFEGRMTLNEMLEKLAQNLVEKELEADMSYWTERGLLAIEGVGREQAVEKGGVLMDLVFNQTKTAQKVAGEAAQTAATTAGVTAQNAAQTSGAAAGVAAQKALSISEVATNAGVAASGAMAAVAWIPMVGPALAESLGPTIFSEAMAFGAATGAAGGEWMVRGDEVPYRLHDREAVMPANIADPMRSFFESGGAAGEAAGGDTHYHNNFSPTINMREPADVFETLRANMPDFIRLLQNAARNGAFR